MENEIKFRSLEELYNRILPALKSKKKELKLKGYKYIKESDIWNFLKDYKWMKSNSLDLSDIVNDIFNINENELIEYIKEEMFKEE